MLPHASAGPSFQRRDVEREVPGHDQPDDAERLAEGEVDAARRPGSSRRGACRPRPRRSGRRPRPCRPRRASRRSACRRCATRAARAPRRAPRRASRAAGAAGARSAGATARQAGNAAFARGDGGRRSPRRRLLAARAIGSSVAGLSTVSISPSPSAGPLVAVGARLLDERRKSAPSSPSSGCQRTPTAKRFVGSSSASSVRPRPTRSTQPLAHPAEPLVVVGLDRRALAEERAHPGFRLHVDLVIREGPGRVLCFSSRPPRAGAGRDRRRAPRSAPASRGRPRAPAGRARAPRSAARARRDRDPTERRSSPGAPAGRRAPGRDPSRPRRGSRPAPRASPPPRPRSAARAAAGPRPPRSRARTRAGRALRLGEASLDAPTAYAARLRRRRRDPKPNRNQKTGRIGNKLSEDGVEKKKKKKKKKKRSAGRR